MVDLIFKEACKIMHRTVECIDTACEGQSGL